MTVQPRLIKQLCWTEKDLPQKVRTKHVHSLHPYLESSCRSWWTIS